MSQGEKSEVGKIGDSSRIRESVDGNETFGKALSEVGFVPANVGRKILSQGKRRETLKKKAPTNPNK